MYYVLVLCIITNDLMTNDHMIMHVFHNLRQYHQQVIVREMYGDSDDRYCGKCCVL